MSHTPEKRKLMATVHAAAKEIGLDEETRRDLQLRATGKASSADMTPGDLRKVVDALKEAGWTPKGKGGFRKEERRDLRFIWVLWGLLADKGAVTRGRPALNAFISGPTFAAKWGEARTDVRFICEDRAMDVIEALKAMCARNGVELNR